jgi:hypothetical protein
VTSPIARGSCHEAGHTVVALHFGFRVEGIDVREGRFCVMCDLDTANKTDEERFIFLAGGIAGEKYRLGTFDQGGYAGDQSEISERGGESIESYAPRAIEIIESNHACFEELKKKITLCAVARSMEMSITGGKNSFKLVTAAEIEQIWEQH